MFDRNFSRVVAAALIALSGTALVTVSFDADARRMGGGASMGRQSPSLMQNRRAITPPPAANAATPARAPAAGAAAGTAAAGARSGASRWLGPIAGIAAGLGIAALLSHMGLSGAVAEFMGSMLLIALLVFAVVFIVRRFRAAGPRPAAQGVFDSASYRQAEVLQPLHRQAQPAQRSRVSSLPSAAAAAEPVNEDNSSLIPSGFDTPRFLGQAKTQFVEIQKIWDTGNAEQLRDFVTDDLLDELKSQLDERGAANNVTEAVLLNAELLRIESVSDDGHLASVRFSGMLREQADAEAFRFEEVWNLFKPASGGWLLAGIQQIPVEHTS
jgi:predicted lipid-binding transport protein (Tim44 family)